MNGKPEMGISSWQREVGWSYEVVNLHAVMPGAGKM